MGLDTSHDCWHGAYSAFMRWRQEIARAAGLPPLELMQGFYEPLTSQGLPTLYQNQGSRDDALMKNLDARLPILWDALKPSPLHALLYHSDCDGKLDYKDCSAIANELQKLLPKLPNGDGGGHVGIWKDKTKAFIKGLRLASKLKEDVDFH